MGLKFGNNSTDPDRRPLKTKFSPVQQQGKIRRETDRGTIEFLHNNFADHLEIHTAVVGDLNGICINHCRLFVARWRNGWFTWTTANVAVLLEPCFLCFHTMEILVKPNVLFLPNWTSLLLLYDHSQETRM